MNKKAFTLVELLAVIVILGIILAIVSTSVFNILEDAKNNAYETQIEMLKASAKEYVTDNKRTLFSESDKICVSIGDLYKAKYIDKLPEVKKDDKPMSEHLGFIITNNNDNITYILSEDITQQEECQKN